MHQLLKENRVIDAFLVLFGSGAETCAMSQFVPLNPVSVSILSPGILTVFLAVVPKRGLKSCLFRLTQKLQSFQAQE